MLGNRERLAGDQAGMPMCAGEAKKKAAWFPRRPFLSYGSHTLAGDFRTSAPGAYFPAVS
jgi:hypothetical protein